MNASVQSVDSFCVWIHYHYLTKYYYNMQIKIKRALHKDLEELQTLFVETIQATCSRDYNKNQIDA